MTEQKPPAGTGAAHILAHCDRMHAAMEELAPKTTPFTTVDVAVDAVLAARKVLHAAVEHCIENALHSTAADLTRRCSATSLHQAELQPMQCAQLF